MVYRAQKRIATLEGMRTRFAILIGTSICLASLLSGCSPGEPGGPSGSPSATPPVSSSPTPSPSATADAPPAEPAAASCENLLNPANLAAFIDAGATLTATPEYQNKIRDDSVHYSSLQIFVDHVMCPVNIAPSFHVLELYGYAPTTPEGEAAAIAQLTTNGWTETASDGGRLFLHPAGGENEDIVFRYFFRNGFAWVAYDDVRLAEIIANSPTS